MDLLSIEKVEKRVKENIDFIDETLLKEILLESFPNIFNNEQILEQFIKSFSENLDESIINLIRDRLLDVLTNEEHGDQQIIDDLYSIANDIQDVTTIVDELIENISNDFSEDNLDLSNDDIVKKISENLNVNETLSDIIRRKCIDNDKKSFLISKDNLGKSFLKYSEEFENEISKASSFSLRVPSLTTSCIQSDLLSAETKDTIEYPEILSKKYISSVNYLKKIHIDKLFEFLLTNLIVHTPCNPISYMIEIIDKLIEYRDNNGPLPVLFDKNHIDALYQTMDTSNKGFITLRQYKNAMKTLRISYYDLNPTIIKNKGVPHDVFESDVLKYMKKTIDQDLIRPSLQPCI